MPPEHHVLLQELIPTFACVQMALKYVKAVSKLRENGYALQYSSLHKIKKVRNTDCLILYPSRDSFRICVAISNSGCISVSAMTSALRYCKEVNLRCSALH